MYAKEQFKRWNEVISQIDPSNLIIHIQNTAATFAYDIPSDMVRVGISMYGLLPDLPKNIDPITTNYLTKFGNLLQETYDIYKKSVDK